LLNKFINCYFEECLKTSNEVGTSTGEIQISFYAVFSMMDFIGWLVLIGITFSDDGLLLVAGDSFCRETRLILGLSF